MSRSRRLCLCAATHPPLPFFTLDDRVAAADFSPDPTASDLLPVASSPSPHAGVGSRSPSWDRSRGKASAPGPPMDGVVEPPRKELLALSSPSSPCTPPPHRATSAAGEAPSPVTPVTEAARTEPVAPARTGKADGEVWVTVFGFSLRDTNLVLREFEKCGVILRHHSGPREGNWIHILYQMVRIDAGTAEEVATGWIDDRGACFFPVPESRRKRKRGEPELEDGASSGVEERSDESSDTVESSIQLNLLPLSSTPRAAGLICRLPWQGYIHAFCDYRRSRSCFT